MSREGAFLSRWKRKKNLPLAAWEMLQFTWIHSNSLFRAVISMFWPCNVATFTLWPCCLFLWLVSSVVTQAQPGKADSYGATGPLPLVGRERLGKMHLLIYLKLIFLTLFWSFLCRRKGYSLFFPLVICSLKETFSLVSSANSRINQDAKSLHSQVCVKSYSIKMINNPNAGKRSI